MAIRIQLRRGTQAQWSATNPVLSQGELVIETNTNQVKIGNGTSAYNSLPYGFESGPAAQNFEPFF